MSSRKLLSKVQRTYILVSLLILIGVAPLFYFLIQQLYLIDADESLLVAKQEFVLKQLPKLKIVEINLWNKYNKNRQLKKGFLSKDSLFDSFYIDLLDNELEPYRELLAPLKIKGEFYVYNTKINLVESEDLISSIAILFTVLLLFLLTGLYVVNKKLSLKIWLPFYDTLRQIEGFELDKNKKISFNNSNIEEFNRLNKSIEKLVEKNKIIYQNQREFIENAAHELQTPIAVFKGKLDDIIQRKDITKGQFEILDSLIQNISKLSRLNKNLLLLSKIEKNNLENITTFSVKEIIEKKLPFFEHQAQQKNIKIKISLVSNFKINGNKSLFEVMVSNLLLNAIQHNKKEGKIYIQLKNNQLFVKNTGVETPLNKTQLFNRFSKSANSQQGNGLGLAIIKKIILLHNWQIEYKYNEKLHCFRMIFLVHNVD